MATETPTDNFVVTGGGMVSRFYLGLPYSTNIILPQGLKTLTGNGSAIPMVENQFTFTVSESVSDGAVATCTPTMSADGTIPFSTISYTKAGTYYYTITENGGDLGGIIYDTRVIKVTMTVTDDGQGKLTATPSYVGGQKFVSTVVDQVNQESQASASTANGLIGTGDDVNPSVWILLASISGVLAIALYSMKRHPVSKSRGTAKTED